MLSFIQFFFQVNHSLSFQSLAYCIKQFLNDKIYRFGIYI